MQASNSEPNPQTNVKPFGLIFGAVVLLIPGYGLYHSSIERQESFKTSQIRKDIFEDHQDGSQLINTEVALARAKVCDMATTMDGKTPLRTLVNSRLVAPDGSPYEDDGLMEGTFLCALDGSTVVVKQGVLTQDAVAAPEDLPTYRQTLVNRGLLGPEHLIKPRVQIKEKVDFDLEL
ncbi:MAG: hypothetical protein AAFY17_03745 [Cyanobacteria bacterium J06642_11]